MWGQLLIESLGKAESEVILAAPFIKCEALGRLISRIPEGVKLTCITRWRPDEIAAGVSDLDVWPMIEGREVSRLLLCTALHAKYYRIDGMCMVGSANITLAALGWSQNPNLELLVKKDFVDELCEFESQLICSSIPATAYLYEHLKRTVAIEPKQAGVWREVCYPKPHPASDSIWVPSLRQPECLFIAYSGDFETLTTASREAALRDLGFLDPSPGFEEDKFRTHIGALLLQTPVVHAIDEFVAAPRRFGEVRRFLRELVTDEGFDATHAWQTLMRWLLLFLPERYCMSVPRYSEIFQKR